MRPTPCWSRAAAKSASWRLGKLENVERAESADLGLRVFVGRRQAIVSTGDLARPSLERLVERALAIARAVPEDPHAGLAEPDRIARDYPVLDLDDGQEPETDALARQAAVAEEAALAHPKITNSEGAAARWSRARTTLVATNGFVGASARSSHSIGASVIAGANGAMERDYEYRDRGARPRPAGSRRDRPQGGGARRGAPQPAQGAKQGGTDRVRPACGRQHGAPPDERDQRPHGRARHDFPEGRARRGRFRRRRHHRRRPAAPDGLRSRAFDAEGVGTERRRLVDQGVLATWLLDCASARQLGLVHHRSRRARRLLGALARAHECLDRAGRHDARTS